MNREIEIHQDSENKYRFSIDGKLTSWIAESHDEAMILALSYKYEGANSRAATYFLRMLKIESKWAE